MGDTGDTCPNIIGCYSVQFYQNIIETETSFKNLLSILDLFLKSINKIESKWCRDVANFLFRAE